MCDTNVANTAIRTIRVLQKLSERDCSLADLLEGFSDDTLRIYLNSLKKCGVKISSPSKIKKEYSLLENFDFLNFISKEYKILARIKNYFSQKDNYEMVMNINNLLIHLSKYTNKENSQKLLKIAEAKPFSPQYHLLIKQIANYIKNKQPLLLAYLSPTSATNYFKVLPRYIKIENLKAYLLAADNSIKSTRYMLLERIKYIKPVDELYEKYDINRYAVCDFGDNKKEIAEFEKYEIINRAKGKITVKIYYENEFTFLQKVLSFGQECKIIEPVELKEVLLQKIKLTEELYEKQS